MFYGVFSLNERNRMFGLVDEIMAEVERDYMKLPVDADGVPIHMGDTVEGKLLYDDSVVKGVVNAYHIYAGDDPDTVYIKGSSGSGLWTIKELQISRCHHVKPRTLEDVLRDFAKEVNVSSSDFISIDGEEAYMLAAINETADEIRELFGGDAE